jgi:hypothetical protein
MARGADVKNKRAAREVAGVIAEETADTRIPDGSRRHGPSDGLHVTRAAGRHDPGYVSKAYRLDPDMFPVLAGPSKGARAATESDKHAVREAIILLRREACSLAWVIGDDPACQLGPKDTVFCDELLARARDVIQMLRPHSRAPEWEGQLAMRLRYREQMCVQRRLLAAKGRSSQPARVWRGPRPPVNDDGELSGEALVKDLLRPHVSSLPAWLRASVDAQKCLAKAVDGIDGAVNLGGKGGRNRGRTPEAWAHVIVVELTAKFGGGNSKP